MQRLGSINTMRTVTLHRSFRLPTLKTATFTVRQQGRPRKEKSLHFYQQLIQPWKTRTELVDDLCDSVLYEDDHLIAINKPSGLPMHTKYAPIRDPEDRSMYSIDHVLPNLKSRLNTDTMEVMLGQDRLMSGVVLYAKTERAQTKMKKYFRDVRSSKKFFSNYSIITVGAPQPKSGQDEVYLERKEVQEKLLTFMVQEPSNRKKKYGHMMKPSFQYTLKEACNINGTQISLLELSATQSQWDSIQVYLLSKTSPVLGDHKYSNRLKTVLGTHVFVNPAECPPAPQVLPREILQRLNIHHSNTTMVPLHVHCHQLTIPDTEASKRQNKFITIDAPLPLYFRKTLECLSFSKTFTVLQEM